MRYAAAVALACPVCDQAWPEGTPRCTCGYDFTTRDPSVAIRRLGREARRGNGIWRRGLIGMIALPVTLFALPLSLGASAAMLQLGLSALWLVQGLARADRANKRLVVAKQLIQLPAARVVR